MLSGQRDEPPCRARGNAERQELHEKERERLSDLRAEAAEHRSRVEMPAQIPRRGERDGHRREQHRDQRSKT